MGCAPAGMMGRPARPVLALAADPVHAPGAGAVRACLSGRRHGGVGVRRGGDSEGQPCPATSPLRSCRPLARPFPEWARRAGFRRRSMPVHPKTIAALQPGDHLCRLYETEAEHRALPTAYSRQSDRWPGLSAGRSPGSARACPERRRRTSKRERVTARTSRPPPAAVPAPLPCTSTRRRPGPFPGGPGPGPRRSPPGSA